MIAWLIRFLLVPTTGNAQNPIATKDVRPTEVTFQQELPLVIDDSTAMAELIRLLGKQSETGMSKTKREENSDS
jgi:hypothetical protein